MQIDDLSCLLVVIAAIYTENALFSWSLIWKQQRINPCRLMLGEQLSGVKSINPNLAS